MRRAGLALSLTCTMPRRLGMTREVSLLYDSVKNRGRLMDSELATAWAREATMPLRVRVAASRRAAPLLSCSSRREGLLPRS